MFMRQLLFITLLLSILTIGPIHGENEFMASGNQQDQTNTTISEVKDMVRNIQTKADINSILGTNYQEIRGEMYNNTVWRFDMYPVSNYRYMSEYDKIDSEGLQEGSVKYIIFFSFGEEENIISKSIYYCDSNGNIREVKYIENTEREAIIFS
ncbi:hypothetical protein AB3U99_16095 [Niallia sp. JL1B1071]|uniref:hypothetical protein n=1 Tax=Niallia tiangongensis TaxID=3237105 RepID=UPI0037DD1888